MQTAVTQERIRLLTLEAEAIAHAARGRAKTRTTPVVDNLLSFTRATKSNYHVEWYHRLLCEHLDRFVEGTIKRLMVFLPPRHGKSEIVSRRLPAYILGRNPHASLIACSYSAGLAARMNRDVQRIIDSDVYPQIFPKTRLYRKHVRTVAEGTWLRNSDIFEIVGYRGVYRSAGVGGGITGMGANYAILDDPIKNQEEADSTTYRERLWEWYTSTFYTRLEKNGSILLTLTRWHQDDLAGRLLQLAKSDPVADQWTVLEFPAIRDTNDNESDTREIGAALWPDKFSVNKLDTIKSTIGTRAWEAMYQQRPSSPEGGMFQRGWWRYYNAPPAEFDEVIQSWDMTFKDASTSDYVVGTVWGRVGANKYLLDVFRARVDFPGTIQAVRGMSAKWPQARAKLVEDKANGTAVIATLRKEIAGLIPVEPQGGKEARASAITAEIESGNVYLPERAAFTLDFVEEFAQFPNGAHDDQVDSTSQALMRLGRPRTSEVMWVNL